ncbi:hypothetical protein K435DRAFT_202431 [Dendrothele bispora CBS 962.96]|uniref:Mid2 domain-containing protein n=1 Tax=Dendrothele bispora (strain CBS 962.96) TaxID=1314807 RepID=A0A4S8MN57_DENBC|nr:hypothetical protein K435DRAFT_202431 [Dendrothele bispora CBS 962.96]
MLFISGRVLLGVVLISSLKALAQISTSTASCTDSTFASYSNSQGQDPCEVAAKVGQICIPSYTIPAISPGQTYSAQPAQGNRNACTCTTIYFSLLSLCSACQDVNTMTPWQNFSSGCASVFTESGFPVTIPSNLAIPDWAFLPLLANGLVDGNAIIADNKPDRVNNSTSISTPQTSSSVQTQTPAPTPAPAAASSSGSNRTRDAAIIAGSVVGGLALLLSVAIVFWYRYWLLKRSQKRRSEKTENEKQDPSMRLEPFVVIEPVEPLPEKGFDGVSRLSKQPNARSSTHGTHLSVLSTQYQHQIVHGQPMIMVQGQNTETSFSTELESRDEVHELRAQVNRLTTEVNRLSRDVAPPAYG